MKRIDNRGSGMITTVVISMVLLALAGAVLYGSYTMSTMAQTNKSTSGNFYNLENVVDSATGSSLKVWLSEAIQKAYKYQLEHWSEEPPEGFQSEFERQIVGKDVVLVTGVKYEFPTLTNVEDYPTNFARAYAGSSITKGAKDYTLDNVRYYTDNKDYTDVYVSIKIEIPPFSVNTSPDYEPVCEITAKDLIIPAGSTANITIEGDLWVDNIIVEHDATLVLTAKDIYVSDDLELGTYDNPVGNAKVTIICDNYYGYGSDPTDETKSSAILIHSMGTTASLNLDGVKNLYLAGHAFASIIESPYGDDALPMGSSISVTLEQLLYVADEIYLEGASNPTIWDGTGDKPTPITENWSGPAGTSRAVPRFYPINSGGYLVYYLYDFGNNQDARNTFYAEQFDAATPFNEFISYYLASYTPPQLGALKLSDGMSIMGAGNSSNIVDPGFASPTAKSGGLDVPVPSYDYNNTAYYIEYETPVPSPLPTSPGLGLVVPNFHEDSITINTFVDTNTLKLLDGTNILSGGLLVVDGDITLSNLGITFTFSKKYIVKNAGSSTPAASWNFDELITISGWTKNEVPVTP